MQDSFICCSCSVSATHLWLWHTGSLFSPQGQDSKSGCKLKKKKKTTLEGKDPATETTASLSCLELLTPSLPEKIR